MIQAILLAALAITGSLGAGNEYGAGYGPDGLPLNGGGPTSTSPTQSTLPNMPCMIQGTDLTMAECASYTGGSVGSMVPHPLNPGWYINCAANGICQPCDPIRGVLQFNVGCQMCLAPGEDCPQGSPPEANVEDCFDDGCPFCSNVFSYEAHSISLNYCKCVDNVPHCMPCPCGTLFDASLKCCLADATNGRQCPEYAEMYAK